MMGYCATLWRMFIKLTRARGKTYAQLTESFRDASGKTRQRTLATLGRIDERGGQVDAVLSALLRAKGRGGEDISPPQIEFESALALGDVWALDQLWHELGFDRLGQVFRRARFTTPIAHAVRAMVFNHLCDADSKLGVLRWLQTVAMPGLNAGALTHQHLLRSMDALMDHQEAVDDCVAGLLRPLIDTELSVVFYDLTPIRAAGDSTLEGDVRQFGLSKEGGIARQFLLGVVQTAEGLPIYHEVFEGNASEGKTLVPTLSKVLARYPQIGRLVVVADRGLLSLDNMEQLSQWMLPSGKKLEFILAVPGRRYGDFCELLQPLHEQAQASAQETVQETEWQGHRLVVAHDPERAQEQTAKRRQVIAELEQRAQQLAGKLDAQALQRAQMMDGKLLMVTNVPDTDMTPQEVLARYKSLADIERGFRVLKSDIEMVPVYHRLPQRIRAHASICFMALIVHRVMRMRLKAAQHPSSPQTALQLLRRVQRHSIRINDAQPVTGVSSISDEQRAIMAAFGLRKLPQEGGQMQLV